MSIAITLILIIAFSNFIGLAISLINDNQRMATVFTALLLTNTTTGIILALLS